MITGPEATIITRAGGAVIRGVKERATATSEWPSLHAGLMELAAILSDWIEAARVTINLIDLKLDGEDLPQRRVGRLRSLGIGSMSTDMERTNTGARRRKLEEDVRQQLTPKVSLVKKLTPAKRRAAARRTLRSVMAVYCPELLVEFEAAIKRRMAWIQANEAAISETLDSANPNEDTLIAWREEAHRTEQGLSEVWSQLTTYIRGNFPMDWSNFLAPYFRPNR